MKERLLTTREVAQILNLSEQEVIELAKVGILPHFKIEEDFLRFKKEDIIAFQENSQKKYKLELVAKKNRWEALKEFWYFNDFYIISFLIILILIWLIFKDF